jgi:uncharacterized membrane protein (DUF2068 family)
MRGRDRRIPLETYELAHHVTATRIMVLVVNIVIVVYLAVRARPERRSLAM